MNPVEKAKNILLERGHVKGISEASDGRVCMMGAINQATGFDSWKSETVPLRNEVADLVNSVAYEQFKDRIHTVWAGVANFNDHPDTTIGECVAVFEKAAVLWEEKID